MDEVYTIRTMTREEIDIAVEWAATEGWNPGRSDAECFYEADPEGFLVGLLDNEPVASISAVKYGKTFGFIGFFIVKPAYRGKGYGLAIWNAALSRLTGRTVGLDGVVAQQKNYTKSGFRLAYRNIRYQGYGDGEGAVDKAVVPLSTLPFETVRCYDAPFFPDDRSLFLKKWIVQPNSTALGVMDRGRLEGYGVLRPCREGFKIGPLCADSLDVAERLFRALKRSVPKDIPFFLDIPEVNEYARSLVERYGMSACFETARMYKGEVPALPLKRIFGVTSFELG